MNKLFLVYLLLLKYPHTISSDSVVLASGLCNSSGVMRIDNIAYRETTFNCPIVGSPITTVFPLGAFYKPRIPVTVDGLLDKPMIQREPGKWVRTERSLDDLKICRPFEHVDLGRWNTTKKSTLNILTRGGDGNIRVSVDGRPIGYNSLETIPNVLSGPHVVEWIWDGEGCYESYATRGTGFQAYRQMAAWWVEEDSNNKPYYFHPIAIAQDINMHTRI